MPPPAPVIKTRCIAIIRLLDDTPQTAHPIVDPAAWLRLTGRQTMRAVAQLAGPCEARPITNPQGSSVMLKIYGIPRSRAFRTLWMAKELGLEYENIPIDFANDGTRTPEYLRINPNGHVPTIDDDGVILWESMAINLYLAKKYGSSDLYPVLF